MSIKIKFPKHGTCLRSKIKRDSNPEMWIIDLISYTNVYMSFNSETIKDQLK